MKLTWLHISDFHVRGGDPYDRDVVLRALVKSVARYRDQGRTPDVIFATGDIAHSGKPNEYEIAESFFNELLSEARLERDRLLLIPGNHDVNRDLGVGLARTLESREQSDTYFRPDLPKPHLTQKLQAYLAWYAKYFSGIRKPAEDSTCGPVEELVLNGGKLAILPVNTALFCLDDNDHGKLWVGRRCLDKGLSDLAAAAADLNMVLVHHPLEWLHPIEAGNIQAGLEASTDILLRGHLHETRVESVVSAEGDILRCAAGAAYQTRQWPNRALYGTFSDGQVTIFPIAYVDSPTEIWTTDPSVFPRDSSHERSFPIRRQKSGDRPSPLPKAPAPARFRSNIGSRGNRPFVGREDLIHRIDSLLEDTSREGVVILHGLPGVGKSELAREFARRNRNRYAGGTFLVDASTNAFGINLASLGQNILDITFPSDMKFDDRARVTFASLGAASVLLIYDNVVSFEQAAPWLPLSGMPCHVLMTTLADNASMLWPCLEVKPLSSEQSLELVKELTGGQLPGAAARAIAEHAEGLPVQILPDAATLAYEQRRGRPIPTRLRIATGTNESFRAAYDRLDQPARLLLRAAAFFNTQQIPSGELSRHLIQALDWTAGDVERTFDTCLDLHLLEDWPRPRIHQLFASFVRETPLGADDLLAFARVGPVQAARFVELALGLSSNPADLDTATLLLNYPLPPDVWGALGAQLSVENGETIAEALHLIGRYEEARPWFERAVAEKEKGDVHGRIDHESLTATVRRLTQCLRELGLDDAARRWEQRYVRAAQT